ncbi:sugar diacid recognition domain-containing protein [Vibrio tritonius]|uniref:sugar diacid recognition domain-containing protein n=1 Tax=Vibrio tritonius TaxID=1435069 RepID=UPI00315CEA3D
MELNTEIAEQIVYHARRVIQYPINVMDADGLIIASTNPARKYQKHSGAVVALSQRSTVEIDDVTAQNMRGTQPGVNLPIRFKNTIIGVIGISGPPNDIRHLGELVKMAAEMTVEHEYVVEQSHWKEQRKKDLLLQWIDQKADFELIESQAIPLKIDLYANYVVCLLEASSGEQLVELHNLLKRWKKELLSVELTKNRVLILLKYSSSQSEWNQMRRFLDGEVSFKLHGALGKFYSDPRQLFASYQSALAALNSGKKLLKDQQYFEFDQVTLPAILDNERKNWQQQLLFEPIRRVEEMDPVLKKTLLIWFENNLDSAKTAEKLFIHRNSLRYRLNKIGEICRLDLNNYQDRVWIYLSLILSPSEG